jgi:ribosomal protein S17E
MKDEEFEKYFERITDAYFDYIGCVRKRNLKQILEEIYQKGYDKCSKDLNDLSDGKLKLYKEAKPKVIKNER